MKELSRQMVHFSGFLLIPISMYLGAASAALCSLCLGIFLLGYSIRIKAKKELHPAERRFGGLLLFFERKQAVWPFFGAFTLFFSISAALFILPINQAYALISIITISDSISTITGHYTGRHRIIGNKTFEGSSTYFAFGLISAYFIGIWGALILASSLTLVELASELGRSHKRFRWIDDNWTSAAAGIAILAYVI